MEPIKLPAPNFLDRIVGFVSPRAGAQRLYFKSVSAQYEQMRLYNAATQGRRAEGWVATGASQNAEAATQLDRIRWRAREFERNNGHAAAAIRKLPAYIVGAGITVRPKVKDEKIRANWTNFVRTSDIANGTNFNAQMALAARSWVRDGEVLLVWHDLPSVERPLGLHVMEVDHLDTAKNAEVNGNPIIQGVEFDRNTGARVAFWMFDQHPGEPVTITRRTFESRRIPAERVDHLFDPLRPGQARGIPWMAPVALRLRDTTEFEEAELIRKKIEACFSVFITPGDNGTVSNIGMGGQRVNATTGLTEERIGPGQIHRLGFGEQVNFGEPRQNVTTSDYLKMQWLAVMVGLGLPYAMGTGDVSNANYSSQREARLDFWTLLDHWQWNVVIPMVYQRAWDRVATASARLGRGPSELPEPAFAPPKRPWVDPKNDASAQSTDLQLGRQTWPDMIAQTGEDPEEQIAELEKWAPRLKKVGVDFFGGKVAAPAEEESADGDDDVEPGEPTEPDADDDDDDNDNDEPAARSHEVQQLIGVAAAMVKSVSEVAKAMRKMPAPVVNLNPVIEVKTAGGKSVTRVKERGEDGRIRSVETVPA